MSLRSAPSPSGSANDAGFSGKVSESTSSRQQLEAALQLLHQYSERNPALDDKDLDRVRALSVTSMAATATSSSGGVIGKKRAGGASSTSATMAKTAVDKKLKELQRRVFVSETIMKKLHNKNKALQREITALKDQVPAAAAGAAPAAAGGSSIGGSGNTEELKLRDRKLRELQLYVSELEIRLKQSHSSAEGGPSACAGSGPVGDSEAALRRAQEELQISSKNLKSLQQQYSDLLAVKVDSVVNAGASTSKINKEVKQFFVILRKKLHEEMTLREAERIATNEQLYQLEKELMSRQVSNKLLQSQIQAQARPGSSRAGTPPPKGDR